MLNFFRKSMAILDRSQKTRFFILNIMIFIGAIFETIGVSSVLPLVSVVTNPSLIDSNKYYKFINDLLNIHDSRIFILVLTICLIIVYAFKNVYLVVLNNVQNHFTTNNLRRISVKLMKCYISQDFLYHAEHNVAELERNVNRDVINFFYVLNNILMLFTESLVCIMLVAFLLITDFWTSMMMILILSLFLIMFMKIVRKRLKFYGELLRDAEVERNKIFLEAFGGIKEVKALGIEKFFVSKYDRAYKDYALSEQKRLMFTFIPRPIMESLCICGVLLFMAIRIVMGIDISSFIPILSVFAVAAIRMLPSFNRISGYLSSIMYYKSSIDELYEDMVEAEALGEKRVEEDVDIPLSDIEVDNLTFAYPSRPEKKIIDDVSLRIPHNKSVAFVGPSGAGKTTLADIILGVIDPDSGTVSVDGIDVIRNKASWHRNVGYIPQSTFLTDDTIRANVAFGIDSDEIDDEKVWSAIHAAQLTEFVNEQPDGIYTSIGERGVKLSGGQRQRIGIARALYNNPGVIVLDEATSALDNETEKAVMDAIYELVGKKTMIIIAHRLTTIKDCDIIYEIRDGKANVVTYDDYIAKS